ncbi:MAG: peptidoglycan DD-metalloendopeptidase family protein [Propionibacteriaceae bacterium]|jgi:murein DD-endopeptidase MepM/ murein hydrolase activator NlpD|nr:peptidoglycan DD-metalloendopeptidase family protein [Propionibacteriaceae bacterium]
MAAGWRYLATAAVGALGVALAGLVTASPAAADTDTIEEVRAQLEQYEADQAALNDQLNQVQQNLANAQDQLAQTQAALEVQRAKIETMRAEVTQVALLEWQGKGMNTALIVLTSADTAGLLRDLTTTQWVATTTSSLLQRYQVEQAFLDELEESQTSALAAIEADEAQAADLSAQAAQKVTDTQALLNRLTAAEQAQLAAERAAASGTASADLSNLVGSASLIKPINAVMTSPYGWRISPITGTSELHDGVDYGAACGTPVWAAANGVVIRVEWYYGYGNRVVVDHGDINGHHIVTSYNHLSSSAVTVGATVAQGQVIAYVGATGQVTGCHLHFCVYVDVDPSTQYAKANASGEDFY